MEAYRVYYKGGRRVLAIPAGPLAMRLSGIDCYPANSSRRRLFRRAMKFAVLTGADRFLARAIPLSRVCDAVDLSQWLMQARSQLGIADLHAVIVWPPQDHRRRLYVHLLTTAQRPVAFAKLFFDSACFARLENETQALHAVQEMTDERWTVPTVLANGYHSGCRFLLTESLPRDSASSTPTWSELLTACVRQYAGVPRAIDEQVFESKPWWKHLQATIPTAAAFRNELGKLQGTTWVCRVHGDLGAANILQSRGKLWLIDWEESDAEGPRLTDEIGYWLSCNLPSFRVPAFGTSRFGEHYLRGASQERRREIMFALAFLHGANIRPASLLIENWAGI